MSNDTKSLGRAIQLLSILKVPLLGLTRPKVVELTSEKSIVELPLNWLTKNHVGSMYFGALAMGAELSIALQVLNRIKSEKAPVSFIFKDFKAQFQKRADTNVHFCCSDIRGIDELINTALNSETRVDKTFKGLALSSKDHSQVFMDYDLTISLKRTKAAVF